MAGLSDTLPSAWQAKLFWQEDETGVSRQVDRREDKANRLHLIYRQARPLPLLLDTSVLQQWAAWL